MIPTWRSWLAAAVDFVREVAAIRRRLRDEKRGAAARAAEQVRRERLR